MVEDETGENASDAWRAALSASRLLSRSLPELRANRAKTLEEMREGLKSVHDRAHVLTILGCVNSSFTVDLLQDLVTVALSHRDALTVRQLLGRISYRDAYEIVPRAVWHQLDETDDDDAYRRMAELLAFLGLKEALRDLCSRAKESGDEGVREVAIDFENFDQ